MTKHLPKLLFIAFIVGNLFKPSIFLPEIKFTFLDLVVGLYWINQFFFATKDLKYRSLKYHQILIPLSLFSLLGLVSLIFSGQVYGQSAQLVGALYLFRFIFYSASFLVFPPQPKILYLGLGVVFIGLIQYLIFPDIRSLSVDQWDPHYYRLVGSLLDPGFTGMILVLFLTWITLYKTKYQYLWWGITYIALALTYSRSSYLAFIVMMFLVSFKKKSASLALKVITLLLITIFILPRPGGEGVKLERSSTIAARIANWQHSLIISADHPILGVGFNVYRYAQNQYGFLTDSDWQLNHAGAGADSSILFVFSTTGLIGLSSYLWYLFRLSKIHNFIYYLLPVLVHSWFLNSLFYPPVILFLVLLVTSKGDN